jgi:hypothetical protein
MMVEVKLEYVFDLDVSFGPAIETSPTQFHETRAFAPITGGRVDGPRLKGQIVGGVGGDFAHKRPDGSLVDAQWMIKADDGALIAVKNIGYGREHAMLHVSPSFEAPEGTHAWLAKTMFVGKGEQRADGARFKIYAVV